MRVAISYSAFCLVVACSAAVVTTASASTATTNASNSTAIGIPDSGPGVPYPSPITVSGLSGTITGVTVTLNGLTHTYPEDVDVMVVAPGGQQVMLMSDVGNGYNVSGITLTFSAASTVNLTTSMLTSGTYLPTNLVGDPDTFPAAPVGTPSTDLATINGAAAAQNGVWNLYVVDNAANDSGTLAGGWTLSITQDIPFASCSAEGFIGSKLTLCRQICEIEQSPNRLISLIRLYMSTYRSEPPCAD